MATVFEGTTIRGFNNKGTMKPLDGGYYDVVLSALEYPNSVGASYDTQSAEAILNSPIFQRRIAGRRLRGELGHPKERDCKNFQDYVQRIHEIVEDQTCIHIRRVWIDKNYILPDGRKIIAIRGEICPSGPYAHVIERIINNPHEDLCFSVRAMATDQIVGGRKRKYYDTIITWDVINDPGVEVSSKYNSVSCESAIPQVMATNEVLVVPEVLMAIKYNADATNNIALESDINTSIEALQKSVRRTKLLSSNRSKLSDWN